MKPTVNVLSGDISKIFAEALITPINSTGTWFGKVDRVIEDAAGDQYHLQAAEAAPLRELQTVVARKQVPHRGAFGDVVFVIDNLKKPLRQVILSGLKAADAAGYRTVTLPTMRMGVMLGVVEKNVQQAIGEMAAAVQTFQAGKVPFSLQAINIVVYNDPKTQALLEAALK